MMGSFLTPLAAGSQAAVQGWRWSYYALAISLTVLFFLFLFAYEETKFIPVHVGLPATDSSLSPSLTNEQIKTADHGIDSTESKDPNVITKLDSNLTSTVYTPYTYRQRMRLWTPTDEPLLKLFMLPLHVITLPHVLFTSIQFAAVVAWLVLLVAMISVIFSMPPYNFTTAGVGNMTLGPFVGNLFGTLYGGPLSDWIVVRLARRNRNVFEPEMRLHLLCVPVITMAGGLIMFGVTSARVSSVELIYTPPSVVLVYEKNCANECHRVCTGSCLVLAVPCTPSAWVRLVRLHSRYWWIAIATYVYYSVLYSMGAC